MVQCFRFFAHALLVLAVFCAGCASSPGAKSKALDARWRELSPIAPEFQRAAAETVGADLAGGNSIETLVNGDVFFSVMLDDIRRATNTITLESYIWSSGEISELFVDALSERASAGVKVHAIADALGSIKLPGRSIAKMRRSGVQFVRYNYPHWWRFFTFWNHRTHRKLLVVDGRIGFIGGACIHDDWVGEAEGPPFWRETHYRIKGPMVAQMQRVFLENWVRMTRMPLSGEAYFPEIANAGTAPAQCFGSSPHGAPASAWLLHLMSIAAAKESIRLAYPYFIPDKYAIEELMEARRRGVRVEIIVPGAIDAPITTAAARPSWIKLMQAGVEMYEYQPTLYHAKVMIVDDVWASAGSVNFDPRSFHINDEANFNVLDRKFAAEQIEVFERDKAKCRRLTAEELKARACHKRFLDRLAGLVSFLL